MVQKRERKAVFHQQCVIFNLQQSLLPQQRNRVQLFVCFGEGINDFLASNADRFARESHHHARESRN